MIGITSYGAYIPRLRLERMAAFQTMGWFAPAIVMIAQGERAMCNWDEDSITMAVEAGRDCLTGLDRARVDTIYMATTTAPFADRQNAGIVATALNLAEEGLVSADFTASQKAGTTALIAALDAVAAGDRQNALVVAADRREAKAAYFYELWFGDGAASIAVGRDNVIARYLGSHSVSCDFVDHYRGAFNRFDYVWEERWVRDEGYNKFIPMAVNGLLQKLGLTMDKIDHLVFPCFFKAEHKAIAKKLGASPEKVIDNLHEVCGETGTAHALLMLTAALEKAKPGERIMVAGFGQGCNALCFEVTEAIRDLAPRRGFGASLAAKKSTDNYARFLKFRDLLPTEMGIRAEAPTQTAMTALYRKRQMILGMVGGRCQACGTPQFPKTEVCVNPACGALHSQQDYPFADEPARIKTFTGDLLAVSVDPPHSYGLIQFDNGGRFMADFTDCTLEDLKVGKPVRLMFRRRATDAQRGFTNYFWKAVPVAAAADQADMKIRFDDQVAIVTGAGGGLGRVYALELARRGAAVVVNDLGGAADGTGTGSAGPADKVVAEILAAGGKAVACYDSVSTAEGGAAIVQKAIEAFGRIDIVINNAGILRDKTFIKMEPDQWQAVLDVHLTGAYNVTRPAFEKMKDQGYGRIVMTTSAAGLYGNFGQANYAAAKMGLVGLMNALKLEGAKYDIKVNTVAPLAASRLTQDVMPPELFAKMKPEFVAPLVIGLCSADCQVSGQVFNSGLGYGSRAAIVAAPAIKVGADNQIPTVEDIAEAFDRLDSLAGAGEITDATTAILNMISPPAPQGAAPAAADAGGTGAVAAVFDNMTKAFKPEAAAGVDVVFQYEITGAGGGKWFCQVKDGACTVGEGAHAKPSCTLTMAAADFLAMMDGKLAPMAAYTGGKLRIGGDVMKSQLIQKLFKI